MSKLLRRIAKEPDVCLKDSANPPESLVWFQINLKKKNLAVTDFYESRARWIIIFSQFRIFLFGICYNFPKPNCIFLDIFFGHLSSISIVEICNKFLCQSWKKCHIYTFFFLGKWKTLWFYLQVKMGASAPTVF